MTDEERVTTKALLRAMMAGIDLTRDLEGHVHLEVARRALAPAPAKEEEAQGG